MYSAMPLCPPRPGAVMFCWCAADDDDLLIAVTQVTMTVKLQFNSAHSLISDTRRTYPTNLNAHLLLLVVVLLPTIVHPTVLNLSRF